MGSGLVVITAPGFDDAAGVSQTDASQELMHWYIQEQVEEEKITSDAVPRLTMAAEQPDANLRLDHEFGERDGEEGPLRSLCASDDAAIE